MENVTINNKTYQYAFDFKKNPDLRSTFNALTKNTFGFDFERWYESGNWSYRYMPYTLFDGAKAVSNVSVSMIDFLVLGELKKFVQIGTTMTDPAYRGKGLSRFLMEMVMEEWKDNCEMIYLFANDEVIDFYPKFDFVIANEYQYSRQLTSDAKTTRAFKLDITKEKDLQLLQNSIRNTSFTSKITMLDGEFLIMFFAIYIMPDSIYYIEDLNAVVFADYQDGMLHIHDVFCHRETSLDDVIDHMADSSVQKAVLGFTPNETSSYDCALLKKENTTLFVESGTQSLFVDNKLMFPVLSHT